MKERETEVVVTSEPQYLNTVSSGSIDNKTIGGADALLDGAFAETENEQLTFFDGAMVWTEREISIVCSLSGDEWSYHIVASNAVITPKIKSKRAPDEDDTRGRDSRLKKYLDRQSTVDADSVLAIFSDFAVYLCNNPEKMDSYMESIADSPEDPPDRINQEIAAKAYEIMQNGDPVKVLMTEFHEHHIGDDEYGRLLILAIASQHVRNTHGIHLTPSGGSGKGKSHAGKTVLHMVPHEWWIESSLSPKALYYTEIQAGTIIFSDDMVIDEELFSIIRRGITNFTKPQEHRTIDSDRNGTVRTIPERIIWIIASVENFMDEQTRNRMIDIAVDESKETDELVHLKQIENAMTGADEFLESDGVLLCREIFRILKNLEPTTVVIPFAHDIDWQIKSNRRNFEVFLEFVKSYALIRHLQRDRTDSGAIIATVEDYHAARELYLTRAEGEVTKLTKPELDIIRALEQHGDCTLQELVRILGYPTQTIRDRIHGRPNGASGGLLGRKEALITCTHENREVGGDARRSVNVYAVVNSAPLSHYSGVVSLRGEQS